MSWDLMKKVLVLLVLLASSTLLFRQLARKNSDFVALVEIYKTGNLISQKEIRLFLRNQNYNDLSFLELNPSKVARSLLLHPLIAEAKVRALLLPYKTYKIHIEEAKPWAIIGDQIYSRDAEVLVSGYSDSEKYYSEGIAKLYKDHRSHKSQLLTQIINNKPLTGEEIKIIKEIFDVINPNIQLLAPRDKIIKIIVNRDSELYFYSNFYELRLGNLDNKLLGRAKRFNSAVPQIIHMGREKNVAYIDLSLSTREIILGKH